MSTLYDLFKVTENATFDEIRESYDRILKKAEEMQKTDKLTEQLRRIDIAYGILSNPEKRKKYDVDLANKRADELLENIQTKPKEEEQTQKETRQENRDLSEEKIQIDEKRIKEKIDRQINEAIEMQEQYKIKSMEEKLKEQKQINAEEKYQRKLQRKTRRLEKKNQQLERERQMNEYGRYLESQGYKVKYPWTWLRFKRLLIAIASVIIALFILWHIPFVKNTLMNLYEENFVVHALVNVFVSLVNGIKGIF